MFNMAVQDEDWKKFLNSTEEDPEEVETDDELEDETEESEEDDDKKTTKKSDKDEGDDTDQDDDSEEDDSDDDDSDEGDDDDKKSDDYQPRLKQFLKSDGSVDLKKLEDSYVESGKNAVELDKNFKELQGNHKQLLDAIRSKPDVAKALFGEEGAKQFLAGSSSQPTSQGDGGKGTPPANHPLIQHLEAQMTNTSKKEYAEFVDAHPEAVTDPEKARKIGEFLKLHGAVYRNEHDGEIPGMKESLEAAYKYYGWDLEIENKESVATAAKKAAATRSTPQGGKRKATKNEVKKAEQFFAGKLGVKLKD